MILAFLLVLAAAPADGGARLVIVADGDQIEWRRGEAPQLLALPRLGEGWAQLARRVTGSASHLVELRASNPGLERPLRGVRVRVSWTLMTPQLRVKVARALFPEDRKTASGWEHVIIAPWGGEGESWWELAEWFCGDGTRYPALRDANPALGLYPPKGSKLLIPLPVLLPEFGRLKPDPGAPASGSGNAAATPAPVQANPQSPPVPTPTALQPLNPLLSRVASPPPSPESPLEYLDGEAVYRLRPREALYSAVVVRFTGQLHAADVNATAVELAKRSGISDVTAIPVGFPVRIPFDLLLPEFLPASDPRRVAWVKDREELAAIKRVIRAANLDGIHVILDAGHGGADTGAIAEDVWESTYVYDVMARVKRVLEQETRATVWTTVHDPALTDHPAERDVLPKTRGQQLLVDPPYDLAEPAVGVHLRWILANTLLERLKKQKVNAERVVFASIHADSLHPAVRGLMVYVPARSLRSAHAPLARALYDCREVRDLKAPRFSATFRSRAEALSTQLGEAIVRAAGRFALRVHPYEPVRSSVIRGGARWVPAVLKYSLVPTSVLIEICNLNNEQDRELLLSWKFREKLAHAIAAGLAEGFSR